MKIFSFIIALIPLAVFAAPPAKQPAKPQNKILWSQWYTITNNNLPQMYLLEEAELRPKEGQVSISQRYWEKMPSGVIQEYYIGSVAKDDKNYSPVAFFVEHYNPSSKVDGRVREGALSVKSSGLGITPQKIHVKLEKNTILSNFLSLFLARQRKEQNGAGANFYSVILEDGYAGVYQLDTGSALFTKDQKKIGDSLCYRVENTFQSIPTTWWITEQGKICRISVPSHGRTQEAVTEKEALSFLSK